MLYRVATPADIPEIMDLRMSVNENRLSDPSKVTAEICEEYLISKGRGWVCEADGWLAGFCIASLADASIWALFVRPDHEGHGIGTALLELAARWLFAEGANEIMLSTDPETRADRFYQAQGWDRGEMLPNGEVRFWLRRS